jgi:hypothetical protein
MTQDASLTVLRENRRDRVSQACDEFFLCDIYGTHELPFKEVGRRSHWPAQQTETLYISPPILRIGGTPNVVLEFDFLT